MQILNDVDSKQVNTLLAALCAKQRDVNFWRDLAARRYQEAQFWFKFAMVATGVACGLAFILATLMWG